MVVSPCSLGMVGCLVVGVNGQVTFAISGVDMTHLAGAWNHVAGKQSFVPR